MKPTILTRVIFFHCCPIKKGFLKSSLFDTYISMPTNAMLSPRLAPPVFGLGLLEAMPDAAILANQDINDANGDGISGKANYVYDLVLKKIKMR